MTLAGTPRPLTVLERGVYRGPHLYSATPMVRIQLDLGELEAHPTNTFRASPKPCSPGCPA